MKTPSLEESLEKLSSFEPHYSVFVNHLKQTWENNTRSLCSSVVDGKDTSVDRFVIGRISAYGELHDVLKSFSKAVDE